MSRDLATVRLEQPDFVAHPAEQLVCADRDGRGISGFIGDALPGLFTGCHLKSDNARGLPLALAARCDDDAVTHHQGRAGSPEEALG